jgi:V8-like Glu-specific endopeptidase
MSPRRRRLARFVTALSLTWLGACHTRPEPKPGSSRYALEYMQATAVTIVGGYECDSDALKAVGALVTQDQQTICSGTLITNDTVLTAAHCIEGEDPSRLFFAVGPAPQKVAGLPIASWVKDPEYSGDVRGAHDIALVHLREPVPNVTPLHFRKVRLSRFFSRPLTFVGYGTNNGETKTGAGIKRCMRIPISEMGGDTFMTRTQGSDTCHGDSGGPVLDYLEGTFEIVGVISSGDSMCKRIGSSARVDVVAPWIEQVVKARAHDKESPQALQPTRRSSVATASFP